MRPQRRRRGVAFSAADARVRPLAGVLASMLDEMTRATETLIAIRARVLLDGRVRQHVVLERAHAREPHFALTTPKRTLACTQRPIFVIYSHRCYAYFLYCMLNIQYSVY